MHQYFVLSTKIETEIVDVHGYLTIAAYIHYFLPGSLKMYSKLYTLRLGHITELIRYPDKYSDNLESKTRRMDDHRWLPKSEMPYPGYCRTPGSSRCIESLCNCKVLKERWLHFLSKNETETGKKKLNTVT